MHSKLLAELGLEPRPLSPSRGFPLLRHQNSPWSPSRAPTRHHHTHPSQARSWVELLAVSIRSPSVIYSPHPCCSGLAARKTVIITARQSVFIGSAFTVDSECPSRRGPQAGSALPPVVLAKACSGRMIRTGGLTPNPPPPKPLS